MKKRNFWALLLPLLALILEILPNGVTMHFLSPPGSPPFITQTSYFDLLPMGYGNFAPLLTASLTVVLLIMLPFYMAKGSPRLWKAVRLISLIAAIVSLCPMAFASYTVIGGLISVSLFAEFVYIALQKPEDPEK